MLLPLVRIRAVPQETVKQLRLRPSVLKDMRLKTVCASISAMHEIPCKKIKKVFSFVTGKKQDR